MGCKESEPKKNNNLKNSQMSGTSSTNLKANPVKRKWEKKEKYDLSQIVVNQQYQETFIENEPIKLRKLKPNYYNLNDPKISFMNTIGEEPETNDPNRKRPNRSKTKIENPILGNSSIEVENSNGKVLIVVPLEDGKRWIKEYDKDVEINQIVEDFINEKKMELPNNINLDWKCNNQPLDLDAKIETLISKVHPTVFLNLDIEQKSLELLKEENDEDENDFDLNDVAKPFKSPFEVYAFSKRNKGFQILNFDRNEIKNSNIEKYNLTSAYCNGNNHLFISGGENSMNINKFWEINLQTNSIEAYDLPSMKRNHSMIFVPNKYVFIVGGNDKIVYYFDCETKKIAKWAELNENHIEPSLILYKNKDLYVFSNGGDEIVFEKSDLSSGKPKFEKIEPRLEADLNNFGQKFFGVCLKDENTFIFLGGENNNENNEFNYEYDIDENLIKKSDLKFKRFNLREKTFMKYNKKIDFLLTDFNRGRPEILVYKSNRNYFNSIFFSAENLKRSNLNNENQKKNKKYNFDMPDFSNNENYKYNFDFNNNVKIEENENNFQSADKNFNNNNIKFNYDGEIPNASTKFTNEAIKSNHKDGMGFDSNNSNNNFNDNHHNKKNSNQEIINEGPEIDSNVRNFDDDNNNNSNRNLNNFNNDNNNNNDDDNNNNVMIVNNEDDNDNDNNNNRMIENEDDNNNNSNDNNNNNKMIENEDDNNSNNDARMIEYVDDNNNNSNNDDNNYDGNLARSSIIINNSKGNEKKSALPLANKTRNKIRSTFLGNSGILDKNDIEEKLGKSFNAGIGGKKI